MHVPTDDWDALDTFERTTLDNWAAESWDRVTLMGPEDGFYDRRDDEETDGD